MAERKAEREELFFMAAALAEARAAAAEGEAPIGAVVVVGGRIAGRGHNRPISLADPTAHAEIAALREAASALGAYRLPEAEVYVTVEPCAMCAGALINARVAAVKYGARDEKAGAFGSVYDIGRDGRLNHRIEVYGGIREAECAALMRGFFRARRGARGPVGPPSPPRR